MKASLPIAIPEGTDTGAGELIFNNYDQFPYENAACARLVVQRNRIRLDWLFLNVKQRMR